MTCKAVELREAVEEVLLSPPPPPHLPTHPPRSRAPHPYAQARLAKLHSLPGPARKLLSHIRNCPFATGLPAAGGGGRRYDG